MTHNLAQDLENCALPSALEMMGERWSFLLLRGALSGIRHFEEFQSTLGIARNILANRLARLVENGIMVRQPMQCDRRKVEYRLTDKGLELAPAMIALRQWGEKWGCGTPRCQVLADKRDRQPIRRIAIQAHDGRTLDLADLIWLCVDEVTPMAQEPSQAA
ncbi:DNA-binding HxlR family transcriptional regulator [Sphingobium sp. OAS761]|uniref:winged helix-turn-helix transcriptional regulator n=1 Tax=Sphingobium sp. OAS761 TaxID=2817901 RepID=UPI00209F265A|nr:helix-turn-helix domain-containing protein [Sphingobium sp. OAS761]MCP1468376.1 DNA-binding HxlR family transcriptional regulator [Sphingobium sp. OAS761]